VRLAPEEFTPLQKALSDALLPADLALVSRRIGAQLYDIAPANDTHTTAVLAVIDWAQTRDAVGQLIVEARDLNPTSAALQWIRFQPGNGCNSEVGRQSPSIFRPAPQVINLAAGCQFGQAVHEIGHAVGLWHEQSREDRDSFVQDPVAEHPAGPGPQLRPAHHRRGRHRAL
jgi:hypothetical protein